jgi:predicted naringenin-chalcone synthase
LTLLDARLAGSSSQPAQPREREHGPDAHRARTDPILAGLAVVNAPASLSQAEVLDRLGLAGDEFAQGIFAHAGVQRRNLNLEAGYLARNLQGRTEQVEEELLAVATQAIDELEIDPRSIGTVVSSSLYSLGCPTLAHRLIERYGMSPTTDKYHVTGVGCASAVPLLRLGVQSLHHDPSRDVLVVAAESMSSILVAAGTEDPRAKTVGSAIFGDGCAAALLTADRTQGGPTILDTQVHQIPGTLDAVTLTAEHADSYLHLARELPDLAASGLSELAEAFLAANDLDARQIDHWLVHPGGRRIVECVRDALGLDDADLATSWKALADHGNVGTPSIFYVLRSTIDERSPAPGERALAVTIGPGVTVGLMLLGF